jgi:hypothetical protein
MINSRNYYPETQKIIEISNYIFKYWFRVKQVVLGTRKFVYLIPDHIVIINKTPCNFLPNKITPYEIFYGRFFPR